MTSLERLAELLKTSDVAMLDFMSSREILLLYCSGLSQITISEFINVDLESVCKAVTKFFGDVGRDTDLDVNMAWAYRTLLRHYGTIDITDDLWYTLFVGTQCTKELLKKELMLVKIFYDKDLEIFGKEEN